MVKTEKTKRVRHVWPADELVHIWAHQRGEDGRNPQGNIFFEGLVLYSYGSHFPVGSLIRRRGRLTAVLLNNDTYSVTTSTHQNLASRATSHLKQFRVMDVLCQEGHKRNLQDYRERVQRATVSAANARAGKESSLGYLRALIKEANDYAEFFGLKTRFTTPPYFNWREQEALAIEETRKANQRSAVREEKRQQRETERLRLSVEEYQKQSAEYPAALAAWRAGTGPFPSLPIDPNLAWNERYELQRKADNLALLRIRGSRIETSRGGVVSVKAALPLADMIRLLPGERPGNERLHRRVLSYEEIPPILFIDDYQVDWIDYEAKVVGIGCHHIPFDEIESIDAQLKQKSANGQAAKP